MEYLVKISMAFFCTLGFAGLFNLPRKALLPAALGGMLAWGMFVIVEIMIPIDFICYFAGGFTVAIYSEILARVLKVPVTVFLVPGVIPLVPGGSLYYAMADFIREEYYSAVTMAYQTASYACAIAAGIIVAMGLFSVVSAHKKHVQKRNQGNATNM